MADELPTDRIFSNPGDDGAGWTKPPRIVDALAAMIWAIAVGFVVVALFRGVMGGGQPVDGMHALLTAAIVIAAWKSGGSRQARVRHRLLIAPRYQLLPVIVTAMVLPLWPWEETGYALHGDGYGVALAIGLFAVVFSGLLGGPWLIGRWLARKEP